jgi:LPS sulfotransferase NodH
MGYDFAIVATQRSGSHLLATALNSHPDIACVGEVAREELTIGEVSGRVRGCILMYNHLDHFKSVSPERVIHLIRENTSALAWSRIENNVAKKVALRGGETHRPHRIRDEEWRARCPVQASRVRLVAHRIAKASDENRRWLQSRGKPLLELTYEEISDGGRDVSVIPPLAAMKVTDFLGVCPATLRTPLQKTGPRGRVR